MKRIWALFHLIFFLAGLPAGVLAQQEDIFLKKKSDSAIKPLVFPKSMHVIESRPQNGYYFFMRGIKTNFMRELMMATCLAESHFHRL